MAGLGIAPAGAEGLNVTQAIEIAIQSNHEYRQLLDGARVAELDLELARAVFRTKISSSVSSESRLGSEFGSRYSVSLSRKLQSGSRLEAGFFTSDFSNTALSELRLRYTRPLFSDPERSGALALRQAERNKAYHERLSQVGAEELAARIIQAYYLALKEKKAIAVQEGIVRIARATLDAVEARRARGMASAIELGKAKLELTTAMQAERERVSRLQDKLDKLKILLGKDVDENVNFDLDLQLSSADEAGEADLERLQTQALQNRTELIASRERVEDRYERMTILAKRHGAPIDISLQYSLVGQGSNFNDSLGIDDQRVGFGLSVDTDLGLTRQQVDTQRAILDYRHSTLSLDRLKKQIRLEVRNALRDLERRRDSLDIASAQATFAERRFELMRIRYAKGLEDALELLRAQQELAQARHQRLVARVDTLLARLALDMTTGRLKDQWHLQFTP